MENNGDLTLVVVILIALIIWLYNKFIKEQKERNKLASENIKLIADNALMEAEHLKFQLQPHTLNNILANLKVISSKLNKGMDALSEILEYILYKGNNHLVSIEHELEFVRQYLKLNDLFISEVDAIKLDTGQVNSKSKYFSTACIPHLITAYFIENAFKHGDVKSPDFLKIEFKLSDTFFEMTVINKVRNKSNEIKGGIGLNNMRKRLDLLLTEKFEIKNTSSDKEYQSKLIIYFNQ